MSGPTGDYQFSGIASRSTFSTPFILTATVAAGYGCGVVFSIYLTNSDLSEYAAVSGNLPSTNGPYYGVWTTDNPRSNLYDLGSRLYSTPSYNAAYTVNLTVPIKGYASASLWQNGAQIAATTLGPIGTGPFRVTLAQRIGLPYCSPAPMRALWQNVTLSRGGGIGQPETPTVVLPLMAQARRIEGSTRI